MNDSPFVATVGRLEDLVGALAPRAQALLYCCAARALLADRADDVEHVLAAAQGFALTGRVPDGIPRRSHSGTARSPRPSRRSRVPPRS